MAMSAIFPISCLTQLDAKATEGWCNLRCQYLYPWLSPYIFTQTQKWFLWKQSLISQGG